MSAERTSLFLMANLGAETSRIIAAMERSEKDAAREALRRAERILEQLAALPDMKPRVAELEILATALRSLTTDNFPNAVSPRHIQSYFVPFAERFMAGGK